MHELVPAATAGTNIQPTGHRQERAPQSSYHRYVTGNEEGARVVTLRMNAHVTYILTHIKLYKNHVCMKHYNIGICVYVIGFQCHISFHLRGPCAFNKCCSCTDWQIELEWLQKPARQIWIKATSFLSFFFQGGLGQLGVGLARLLRWVEIDEFPLWKGVASITCSTLHLLVADARCTAEPHSTTGYVIFCERVLPKHEKITC